MTEEKSTEIARRDAGELPVRSLADLTGVGTALAQSGMFGGCSPAKGATIAAICIQERMSFLEFKRSYHVSDQGDVMMRSDRMLAEFMSRGGKMKWLQYDHKAALAEWSYGENQGLKIGYTIEEAETAGFVKPKSNWVKDPGSQLRARAISRAVRMLCPAAIAGTYTPEEMADVHTEEPRGPQPLNPAEAARRVQATVVDSEPEPDYTVCPLPGKKHGVSWSDMTVEELECAHGLQNSLITTGHRAAIMAALTQKQGE